MTTTRIAFAFAAALGAQSVPVSTAEAARGACQVQRAGDASWYGPGFHGRTTANGERFNQHATDTAAHKTLPFNSVVRVTDKQTGRSVNVRINDRGPFVRGRIIDLSRGAANRLGMTGRGRASVNLDVVRCGR